MEGAKDPDEFIKKNGPDAFSILLDRSENHIEYKLLAVKSKYDLNTDDGKIGFLKEATEFLASIPNAVEREIYGRHVAELSGVSIEAIQSETAKAGRRISAARKKERERQNLRPDITLQPASRELGYNNPASAAAEEGVIRLLMIDTSLLSETGDLTSEDFTSPLLGKIFEMVRTRAAAGEDVTASSIAAMLNSDEASQFTALMQKPTSASNAIQALKDYIDKIKTEQLKSSAGDNLLAVRERLREKKGFGG